jgi:LPXTG-motif cell wall-anchored protein
MTQHTTSTSIPTTTSNTRRRAGLVALAALGLPLGAMLAPTTAAAAPGDSFDDIDMFLPLDELPLNPADLLPRYPQPVTPGDFIPLFPVLPTPVPPIPIPVPAGPSTPDDVPGPDDGPGGPFELPELDDPFGPVPFDPSDLVFPTDPGDDDDEEPECAEYAAANFDVEVERYDADLIELRLMYSDMDVCDFTVWTAIAEPGAAGTLSENTVGMENVAFATDSAGYYQQTLSDFDLCDLEIRVAVEESLAFTIPHTDPGCETGGEDEVPGDDGETPDDGGDTPDDGGDTPDDGGDTPDDGDDTPDDGDDTPDDGDETPDDGDETPGEPETPGTPSGGLPQTGTNLNTVMLAVGLMTLGAGSIIALATRRREERPIA